MDTLQSTFTFPNQKPNMPFDKKIRLGWFTANNQVLLQKYLNNICKGKSTVIEFGTWLGVSANFIADNISSDSTLICVDWWKGDTSIGTRQNEDELYHRYIDNVWNNRKKIIPVRMDGRKAAVYISKLGVQPDLIYLDMGHSYEEVIGDLNVLTKEFPNVVIVGDDYMYWPGVKKAVLETRYRLDIPYLDVDKNCYALLYDKQDKYMTYDNDAIGKKTKRFYDKTVRDYSTEEIQYSLTPEYVSNTVRIFIIPVYKTKDINLYKNLLKDNKSKNIFIVVLSKKKESIFSIYNYGYKYFNDTLKKKGKKYTFIFIDPEQIVDSKDYKCCDGLLSITTFLDYNKDIYSSFGNLSIGEATMNKLKFFPHNINNKYIERYSLYYKIINMKLIIYQSFVKKNIGTIEIGHLKNNKQMMKRLYGVKQNIKKKWDVYMGNTEINLHVRSKKVLSDNIYIIIV